MAPPPRPRALCRHLAFERLFRKLPHVTNSNPQAKSAIAAKTQQVSRYRGQSTNQESSKELPYETHSCLNPVTYSVIRERLRSFVTWCQEIMPAWLLLRCSTSSKVRASSSSTGPGVRLSQPPEGRQLSQHQEPQVVS